MNNIIIANTGKHERAEKIDEEMYPLGPLSYLRAVTFVCQPDSVLGFK